MKKFYVDIKGGLGYNLSFIRFAASVDTTKYQFYVRSPYWDVFEASSAIAGVYKPEEIRDFIFDAKNNNGTIIEHRLYDMDSFIKKEIDYQEAWRQLLNIPKTDISKYEIDFLDKVNIAWPNVANNVHEIYKSIGDSEYIIVQFCGGQSPLDPVPNGDWSKKPYDYQHEPLKRHYPTDRAQMFTNIYKKAHPEVKIIQYALPNEPLLNNCEHFVVPYLAYYELAKNPKCKGFVSIDSSLQHLITGLTKGTVIWGHSLPENFGYKDNKNIVQNCRRDDILYFTELGPSGAKIDYISPEELFKAVEEK